MTPSIIISIDEKSCLIKRAQYNKEKDADNFQDDGDDDKNSD